VKPCTPPTPVLRLGDVIPLAPAASTCDNVKNMLDYAATQKATFDAFITLFHTNFMASSKASNDDVILSLAPVKGYQRSREKTDLKYGGDVHKMSDLVRGGMYFRTLDLLNKVVCAFRDFVTTHASMGFIIVEAEDKFAKPQEGYSDFSWKVRKDGFNMELQMNTCAMMTKKEEAHKVYEKTRSGTLSATATEALKQQMLGIFAEVSKVDTKTCKFPSR